MLLYELAHGDAVDVAVGTLDDPQACDRIGPTAAPLIERLKSMGGGTTPTAASQ